LSGSSQKITVSLPSKLVEEIDEVIKFEMKDFSDFMNEAARFYLLRQRQRLEMKNEMIAGYSEMASINLTLAEMGLAVDMSSLATYEGKMSKGE
jgi:CopG family transcriptional regulator/antitoxin EndoAI